LAKHFFIFFLDQFLGEPCTNHRNQKGNCVELPTCESLITLYRTDRSQGTIDILLKNQANCGNRKVGRNPLMCCSDGVPQEQSRGPACTSPDNLSGYCINVKQCQPILDEFLRRRNDPEYVRYIQQSNANCNYQSQAICCPNNANPATQPPQPPPQPTQPQPNNVNTASRLASPSECGVSKVPHNRVVGGVPAKKGIETSYSIFFSSSMKSRRVFCFALGFPNIFFSLFLLIGFAI
jgi:hypothetical protein